MIVSKVVAADSRNLSFHTFLTSSSAAPAQLIFSCKASYLLGGAVGLTDVLSRFSRLGLADLGVDVLCAFVATKIFSSKSLPRYSTHSTLLVSNSTKRSTIVRKHTLNFVSPLYAAFWDVILHNGRRGPAFDTFVEASFNSHFQITRRSIWRPQLGKECNRANV
jgi:hypothetical protein